MAWEGSRTSRRAISSLLAVPCILFPDVLLGKTWHVSLDGSGDFPAVQPAITAAGSGDTILVSPGTYVENIRFAGRDIVLMSIAGPDVTTLDGSNQPRSVVEFHLAETNACLIQGFTITGGTGSAGIEGERVGGGISIIDAEPTVLGNVIRENHVNPGPQGGGQGGGIYARAGHPNDALPVRKPRIISNLIEDNSAYWNGGGIGLQEKITADVSQNVIRRNRTVRGDGAGIWLLIREAGDGAIEANQIDSNDASDHGGGIIAANLFHNIGPPLTLRIRGNVISLNLARGRAMTGDSGGGIWLDCINANIASNTVVANQGQGGNNNYGGGIVLRDVSTCIVERNIVALTRQGGGIRCDSEVSATLSNNLLWGNDGGDAVGACQESVGQDGNLAADPLFCSATTGDYSLAENSPAISHPAGTLGAVLVPGCSAGTLVLPSTWSRIKLLSR